jgi:hypothetical protein
MRSVFDAELILEHDFLGMRILCCDFKPLTFHERIGQNALWRAVKDFGAFKVLFSTATRAEELGTSRLWEPTV